MKFSQFKTVSGMRTDRRDDRLDAVKAVLIVCVILGHSTLANVLIPDLHTIVLSFHVHCFLLFPFLFRSPKLDLRSLINIFVRYFVPYAIFVFVFGCVKLLLAQDAFQDWIVDYAKAVITGNVNYLKVASGFRLFWFMPVILLVNIVRILYYNQTECVRRVLLVLLVCAHILLPTLPWEVKKFYPGFGSHIALYIVVLGILAGFLWKSLGHWIIRKLRYVLLVAFLSLLVLMLNIESKVNLGHLGCPSYHAPFRMLLHDLIPLLCLFTFIGFSDTMAKLPFLPMIGRRTLQIYLLHQLFVRAIDVTYSRQPFFQPTVTGLYAIGLVSVVCGVVGPVIVTGAIDSVPRIRMILFPRGLNDLWSKQRLESCPRPPK